MKKLLALALLLVVSACSSIDTSPCCSQAEPRVRQTYRYQQEPTQVYRAEPMVVASSGCQEQVRTVREPVEVVYKRTTYRTVYEPKTTSSVDYERRPYSGECSGNWCK